MASYGRTETAKPEASEYGKDPAALLERAKACYELVRDATTSQSEREREVLRFQVPSLQWTDDARAVRQGSNTGPIVTPARPILSVSQLDQPIQLIMNQAQQAHLGIEIHPVDEFSTDDTAEVYQDLIRRIERDSPAQDARLWALDRAVKCGRGAYRVSSHYDEDAGDTFDQELTVDMIQYQSMVFFDPAAVKPDCSDGEWAFVMAWVELDAFKRLYPKAKPSTSTNLEWSSYANEAPSWMKMEGKTRFILVAEYWYKEHQYEELKAKGQKRTKDIVSVYVCKLCGYDMLEEPVLWDGKYIPLIPVYGRKLQPIDGEIQYMGVIEPAMDGQRLKNLAASTLAERLTQEPKAPWVGFEDQIAGYEDMWQQQNIRNMPMLYIKPVVGPDGQVLPPPARTPLDQTGMSLALTALQTADQFIQTTTFVYDQSLGRSRKDESGRKVLALQGQSDASTSHYLSYLARAMEYEAKVLIDLIPKKYDRPGRVTQVLGAEGESRKVMINAHYVEDPQTGKLKRVAPGTKGAKFYDFENGKYTTAVSIGKSFQTRLQEGSQVIGDILTAKPELTPLLGPTYFRFQDFPGAHEIADQLKILRDQQYPALAAGKEGEQPSPEALQAQVTSMGQQIQQMAQQNQAAMQQIQTDQAKQQAQMYKAMLDAKTAQMEAQKDIELQRMRDATSLAVAEINARAKGVQSAQEAAHEAVALAQELQHESEEAAVDRAHEVGMAAAGAAMQPQPGDDEAGEGEMGGEA